MNKYFSILICLVSFQLYTPLYCQQWNEVNPELGAVVDIFELGGTLYTVSNLGLVGSSKDNGITWQTNDIYDVVTLPNGITTCISFFDPGNGLIGVRDVVFGNQLLKSNSSELGWEVSSPEYDQNCSSAFIPINLFRVNDSTMILDGLQSPNYRVTYDKGVTWQCVDNFSGLTGIQVLTVRSDSEWLFNDGEGLHKTTDGGQTWSRISDKNFTHYQELNAQTIIGLTLYIDEPNGIPVIYTTTDDFETVDQIPLTQFEDEFVELFVATSPNDFYLLANGTDIYYSEDGGESFSLLQPLSNQFHLSCCFAVFHSPGCFCLHCLETGQRSIFVALLLYPGEKRTAWNLYLAPLNY